MARDWRLETAADVGPGSNRGDWDAYGPVTSSRTTATCPPGQHHMIPDGRGGGVCACGESVSAEEAR